MTAPMKVWWGEAHKSQLLFTLDTSLQKQCFKTISIKSTCRIHIPTLIDLKLVNYIYHAQKIPNNSFHQTFKDIPKMYHKNNCYIGWLSSYKECHVLLVKYHPLLKSQARLEHPTMQPKHEPDFTRPVSVFGHRSYSYNISS